MQVRECILWLSIVFITILCTPQPTIVRWSSTPPVSTEVMHQWKGFCALIANAYYKRGMAWWVSSTFDFFSFDLFAFYALQWSLFWKKKKNNSFYELREILKSFPKVKNKIYKKLVFKYIRFAVLLFFTSSKSGEISPSCQW